MVKLSTTENTDNEGYHEMYSIQTPGLENHGQEENKNTSQNSKSSDLYFNQSGDEAVEKNQFLSNGVACEDSNPGEEISLLYKLTDTPPLHFLILFALQQCFLVISTPLGTTVVVAEAVCAQNDDLLKTRILSATFFMMGLSTFAMTTFGVRLPVFQGPNPMYIIPLLFLRTFDEFKCPETFYRLDPTDNSTTLMARLDNDTVVPNRDVSLERINAYAGTLILVGVVHSLTGALGLVSVIGRLVGPITIVPLVLLFGVYINTIVASFAETHWPTALLTAGGTIVFGLYLNNHNTPVPYWTRSRGFHIVWKPLHQTFALLLSMALGWGTCGILTALNVLSGDENSKEYLARTDARLEVVYKADWFIFPYPGQFGRPGFSVAAIAPFAISFIASVLDSIGDYNASAKVASTPKPPNYALNRGIAVEGIMSILSGAFGCGHATVSFGENIGAIGISRVASRSVFQAVGILYILFAFFGKFGAFFITIPYSVIGGTQIVTFGILIGVILSYLEMIDLRSQRNMSILGISILLALVLSGWISKNPNGIRSGASELDSIIRMFLSNPSFTGAFFACVLDNTIPGTAKERGIAAQARTIKSDSPQRRQERYQNSTDVYRLPWLPARVRRSCLVKFIPIFDRDSD